MKLRFAYVTLVFSFIFLFFHLNVTYAQTSLPSCTSVLANESTKNACFSDDDFRSQVEDFLSLYNGAGNGCLLNSTTFTSVADFIKDHPDLIYERLLEFQGAACPGFLNMAQGHFIYQCKCNLDNEAKNNNDFKTEIQQRFIKVVTDKENPVELSGTPIILPTNLPTPTTIIPFPTPKPGDYTPKEWFVETDGELQSYGDSCGLAGVTGKDMCCLNQVPAMRFKSPSGFTDQLLGFAQSSVNFLIDKVNLVSQTGTMTIYNVSESIGSKYTPNPFCYTGKPSSFKDGGNKNPYAGSCTCEEDTIGSGGTPNEAICNMIDPVRFSTENAECIRCYTGGGGVWTALGCVETDFGTFITKTVFGTGISIAGLVALLCIIYASFLMQTSRGNPEQITKAQEMLTSCITGLIMIIFSVLILRFIGVDLLRIPGLAGSETNSVATSSGSDTTTVVSAPTGTFLTTPVPTIKTTSLTPTTSIATTPTEIVTPTNTPVPTPTVTRDSTLGAFDCDPNAKGPLANEIYLYNEVNHQGQCVRLTVGKYGLNAVHNKEDTKPVTWYNPLTWQNPFNNGFGPCKGSFNDCISSVKMGKDVKVTFYQDYISDDFNVGGCKIVPTSDSNDLNVEKNNDLMCRAINTLSISYAVVEPK